MSKRLTSSSVAPSTGSPTVTHDVTPTLSYPSIQQSTASGSRKIVRHLRTLRLVREASFVSPNGYPETQIPIRSPRDVYVHMAPFAEREANESFWILPLNAQHRLIGGGPTVISRGILNASLVHPREVFCAAIVAQAMALILCHNHPSGDPTPSADDKLITTQLVAAGRLLDIPVHDHIVVGAGRYVSFAEAGLI